MQFYQLYLNKSEKKSSIIGCGKTVNPQKRIYTYFKTNYLWKAIAIAEVTEWNLPAYAYSLLPVLTLYKHVFLL
jgi:hypothetical protein